MTGGNHGINHGGVQNSPGVNHGGAQNLPGVNHRGAQNSAGGNGQNVGGSNHQNIGVSKGNYSDGSGYGYQASYAGSSYAGGYPSGTMTYTTGTYAGVNVMYPASGQVGYSGNVAIMYSTSPPQAPPGGPLGGPSMRDRRLPLLLNKQPPDPREGEEPTYVTVKAKK